MSLDDIDDDFARLEWKDKFLVVSIAFIFAIVAFALYVLITNNNDWVVGMFIGGGIGIGSYLLFTWARGRLGASWISIAITPPIFLISAFSFFRIGQIPGLITFIVLLGIGAFIIYQIEKRHRDPIYREEKKEARLRKQQMKKEEIIFKREMAFLKKKQEVLADATAIKEYEQKLKMRYKDLEHQENVIKKILEHVKETQGNNSKVNPNV